MAYRSTRLPGARRVRPLRIDPLEERALLSVDGLKPDGLATFDYGLTVVKREYDAWLSSTPALGTSFQPSDPYVQTYGNMVAITAVTAHDPQVLHNQLQSIGLQRPAALQSVVSGLLPLAQLDNLAQLSSVTFVKAAYAPYSNVGAVTSQADIVSNGIDARTEFGVDGTGVKIGVMSDTFNHQGGALVDYITGDLPPLHEIDIVRDESFFAGFNSDEGRAMMQLIHDVAPGATLAFRDAGFSEIDFALGVRQLAYEAQSDIIVDDIGFFDAPYFQDGFIAQAVDEVVGAGVAYFSSAGNNGNSSYEASFQPSFFLPAGEFDSEEDAPFFFGGRMHGRIFPIFDMPENAFIHLGMQWDEPFFSVSPGSGGSQSDYDIYLFSDDFDPIELEGTVVAGSVAANIGGDPFERLVFLNEEDGADYFLVIVKYFEPLALNFTSTNVPLAIPDNGPTVTSSLVVPQGGLPAFTQITDVNVQININHPAVGELTVSLVSPNGTVVDLVANTGGTGSNFFNTTFDDEAETPIDDGNAPFAGIFQPTGNLADFDGQNPFGTWQLQVTDSAGGNTGSLVSWSISISTDVDPTPNADLIKLINFTGAGSMPIFGINGNSTIYGHANAAGAQAVGAVFYGNSPGFGNPVVNESFSSWGGTPILFDTNGVRLLQPEVRMKPEVSAPDGTNTTFFPGPMIGIGHFDSDVEPDGFPNFFGTSAAAPHAAAVAALMLEALPTATPAEIYNALHESTYDMGTPGFDFISGHGFVLADRAIATLTLGTRGSIGGTVFNDVNGDGTQNPGENGIENRVVFIDVNRNGELDEIEERFSTINQDLDILDASLVDPTTITGRVLISGVPTAVLNGLVVELNISHTSVGDLDIVLISPLGTRVKLIENRGDNRSHLRNTAFDDSAPISIVDGAPPYTGRFQPEEPLSVLLNDDPNGFWLLEITDSVPFNVGKLHDWSIVLTYDEPSVVTDANGDYQFNDLPFAAYSVRQEVPSGFEQTSPISRAENSLLITEIDIGPVDKFEIQHTGPGATPLDTRGWFVAVSDAPFSDINAVNPVIWELPDEILPGQVLYRTDSPGEEFFGTGIFWNSNNSRIGSGWVMIVDNDGKVVDWVGWGWTVADINNFNVTINGVTIDSLQGAWSGAGSPRTGSGLAGGSVTSLQRTGSFDTNTASDFVWFGNPSIGETNVLAGLQLPVVSRGLGAAQRVNFPNLMTTDLNFGTRTASAVQQDPPQQNPPQQDPPQQDPQQPPANNDPPPQNNNNPPPAGGNSGGHTNQPQSDRSSVGLFDAATSMFFLRDELAAGPADNWFSFGPAGSNWKPLTGDWDGNGSVTVGLYDADTGTFYLKNSNTSGPADIVFRFGPSGADWTPLVGDWNGDGLQTVGLYSGETFFLRDAHAAGPADAVFSFGPANNGWTPITGDWNNDGSDSVGFYTGQSFFLRNSHAGGMADESFTFGPAGAGWVPLAGDWNGDGQATVGLYSGETFFLRDQHAGGAADHWFAYGPNQSAWMPLSGTWVGLGGPALHATGGPSGASTATPLAASHLEIIVDRSIDLWQQAGLAAWQVERLRTVDVRIADLPGTHLGLALPSVIYIDSNAAGWGWHTGIGSGGLDASRVDLLTVVSHELGHVLGLGEAGAGADGLMSSSLSPGVRRVPTTSDVDRLFEAGLWEEDDLLAFDG